MISNIYSQTNNNYSNRVSFQAIPRGGYQTAKNTFVTVLELEKSDLPSITRLCENIGEYFEKYNITDPARQDIMKDTFHTAKDVLSSTDKLLDDAKVFVGVCNNKLNGILIGNMPKKDKAGRIHYSSRKNHTKNERELDWFVTWGGKGVGKSLIGEFFESMKEYPFKKLFVRSEVPELSSAQSIYERFGFKQVTRRGNWVKQTNNINLTDEGVTLENSDIIPMVIKRKKVNQTADEISKQCNRKSFNYLPPTSVENFL